MISVSLHRDLTVPSAAAARSAWPTPPRGHAGKIGSPKIGSPRLRSPRRLRSAGLAAVAAGGVLLAATAAMATPVTVTGTWSSQTITLVPNIPSHAGVEQTTFTSYIGNGSYDYALLPFTVSSSGTYTASATTAGVTNTAWFLTGLFTPSAPPTQPSTPIGNFFAGVFAGTVAPYTSSFSDLQLTANTQYSALIAFNTGGTYGETYTLTLDGPGCIAIGDNACAVPEPASFWSLGAALAGLGLVCRGRLKPKPPAGV